MGAMNSRWIILAMAGSCIALQAAATVKPPDLQALAEPAYFKTGVLTLQDRIWAQTQIERVYYNHRLWPKENPDPKPPSGMRLVNPRELR